MGYGDYLKALLRPLGLYKLEDSINGSELESIGGELDLAAQQVETLELEMNPLTAEDYGLENYRTLFLHKPAGSGPEPLRADLTTLLRLHNQVLTPARAAEALEAWGLDASISDDGNYVVTVTFHTAPEDLSAAKAAIEALLPCHLQVNYN